MRHETGHDDEVGRAVAGDLVGEIRPVGRLGVVNGRRRYSAGCLGRARRRRLPIEIGTLARMSASRSRSAGPGHHADFIGERSPDRPARPQGFRPVDRHGTGRGSCAPTDVRRAGGHPAFLDDGEDGVVVSHDNSASNSSRVAANRTCSSRSDSLSSDRTSWTSSSARPRHSARAARKRHGRVARVHRCPPVRTPSSTRVRNRRQSMSMPTVESR